MRYKRGGVTVSWDGRPVPPEQIEQRTREFQTKWLADHPEAVAQPPRPVGLLALLEHTLAETDRILEATR